MSGSTPNAASGYRATTSSSSTLIVRMLESTLCGKSPIAGVMTNPRFILELSQRAGAKNKPNQTSRDLVAASVSSGQIFTDRVSVMLGAYATRLALKLRLHPSHLTLAGLVIGIASSGLLFESFASHNLPIQLAAVLGYQLSYVLDCADGQLARVTGKTSSSGADLDILVDIAVSWSLASSIAAVAIIHQVLPPWFIGIFASSWSISSIVMLVTRNRLPTFSSETIKSANSLVWFSRQLRDYPLGVLIITGSAAFSPDRVLPWAILWYGVLNMATLGAHIVLKAKMSLHKN
jgi:phosphatidylglycerophosphate synthase